MTDAADRTKRFQSWVRWIDEGMHDSGLSRREVAEASGISAATLDNWFSRRGKTGRPEATQAAELAKALGLSPMESLARLAGVSTPGMLDYARVTLLERELEQLRKQMRGWEEGSGPLTILADVCMKHGFAVSLWPAYERANAEPPARGLRIADRLQIVPSSRDAEDMVALQLRRGADTPRGVRLIDPEKASSDQRTAASMAIGNALEGVDAIRSALIAANCERIRPEDRVQFPLRQGVPAARYAVNRFARERAPELDRVALNLQGHDMSEQILVLSTTLRAWPSDVGAYLARALGWGLHTTRSVALRLYGYPMANQERRGKERDRLRDEALEQLLREEWTFMKGYVIAHYGYAAPASDDDPITAANHAFLRLRRSGERQRWPFVIFLLEDNKSLEKQVDRAPYLDMRQLIEARELLLSQVQELPAAQRHIISVGDVPRPARASEAKQRELLWGRTIEDSHAALRRIAKAYAPGGRMPQTNADIALLGRAAKSTR